jgi:hypothetical protein
LQVTGNIPYPGIPGKRLLSAGWAANVAVRIWLWKRLPAFFSPPMAWIAVRPDAKMRGERVEFFYRDVVQRADNTTRNLCLLAAGFVAAVCKVCGLW